MNQNLLPPLHTKNETLTAPLVPRKWVATTPPSCVTLLVNDPLASHFGALLSGPFYVNINATFFKNFIGCFSKHLILHHIFISKLSCGFVKINQSNCQGEQRGRGVYSSLHWWLFSGHSLIVYHMREYV